MEKKALIVLFLAVTFVLSGCIFGNDGEEDEDNQVPEDTGIMVSNFTSDFEDLRTEQVTNLKLNMKNVGGEEAKNVRAKLYNVPFGSCSTCWTLMSSSPPCNNMGNQWVCPEKLSSQSETGGNKKTLRWQLEAPSLERGTSITYGFYSRIYYRYKTVGTSQFTMMTGEEYRSKTDPSREFPTVDNTEGPLEISIKSKEPAVIYEGQDTVNFCVEVENKGEGTPYSIDAPVEQIEEEDKGLVDLSIEFGNMESTTEKMKLVGDKDMHCVRFDASHVEIRETPTVKISAEYGYYKDNSIDLEVKGE